MTKANLIRVLGIFCAFMATQAQATDKPRYTTHSLELVGEYAPLTHRSCKDERGRPCTEAVIKHTPEGLVIQATYEGRDEWFKLFPVSSGALVFKWTNPQEGDCDDPGCGNLISISGVVYPKKINGKWTPALKMNVVNDFPFPEEPGDPSGLVTTVLPSVRR